MYRIEVDIAGRFSALVYDDHTVGEKAISNLYTREYLAKGKQLLSTEISHGWFSVDFFR